MKYFFKHYIYINANVSIWGDGENVYEPHITVGSNATYKWVIWILILNRAHKYNIENKSKYLAPILKQ